MSLVFEKLTQVLSAGQVWRLTIAADFFRIAAAAWPVKVRIMKDGRILGEMDGWQAGDFVRDVQFDAVEIEAGSIAQAVTVQIAGGGVGSDRVLGEVSVIDGGGALSRSGAALMASIGMTSSAGTYAIGLLWNPVASGKEVEVSSVLVGNSVAGNVIVGRATGVPAGFLAATQPTAKIAGGTASAAESKYSNAGTTDVVAMAEFGGAYFQVRVDANQTFKYGFKEPVILTPGSGIFAASRVTASVFAAAIEMVEK